MPVFVMIVSALVFIAVPVLVITSMVRTRQRQKTWIPTNAKLSRVHTESRGSGDDARRTVLVGTYEYYDQNEQMHTGSGDLGSRDVALDGSPQAIAVLVDPLDPTRSQIDQPTTTGSLAVGVVFVVVFGTIGLGVLMKAAFMLGAGG